MGENGILFCIRLVTKNNKKLSDQTAKPIAGESRARARHREFTFWQSQQLDNYQQNIL
jgi:hypothetical protein